MLPPWLLPFKLNLQGNTGWPDRMILFIHPFLAFIEFKAPGQPLVGERNQPERIKELRARGYHVLITDSAEEAFAFLAATCLSTTGRTLNDLSGMRGIAEVRARNRRAILEETAPQLHCVGCSCGKSAQAFRALDGEDQS